MSKSDVPESEPGILRVIQFMADQAFAARRRGEELRSGSAITSSPRFGSLRKSASATSTWSDPEVRKARSTKHHVTVTICGPYTVYENGKPIEVGGQKIEYRSVKEAFTKLNLPEVKHIALRLKVKAEGKAVFVYFKTATEFLFELVK